MASEQPIDTEDVKDRRDVHYSSCDEVLDDVRKLAQADRDGKLVRKGNWTLGQACGHLAGWLDYGYDGYPLSVPLFIRLVLRPMKNRFLRGPLPAGKRIPGAEQGTFAIDVLPTEQGISNLENAVARLQASAPSQPNPIFGPLTHEEWIKLFLRHSELHLSFFNIQ